MPHVVLLGDSIFDNARYVPDRPCVVQQLRDALPAEWSATLLAVDGHIVVDVVRQLAKLPADATHLVVSVGGNDALGASGLLREPALTVGEALVMLHERLAEFADEYADMLRTVRATGKPVAVCTVYDAIPGMGTAERTGLAGFNEAVLRAAVAAGVPVVDLRLVCTADVHFSPLSSIEPSHVGGARIADVIARLVTTHDFGTGRTTVYV